MLTHCAQVPGFLTDEEAAGPVQNRPSCTNAREFAQSELPGWLLDRACDDKAEYLTTLVPEDLGLEPVQSVVSCFEWLFLLRPGGR